VYFDGVRQNEAFGDIVTWDLIPKAAIASATLIPGSDPVYGLNTLGGAIAVRTLDGLSAPGLDVEASGGRFGRQFRPSQKFLLRGGNNLCATQFGYVQDFWRATKCRL
jgi:outer membrane receptor protein involved in Fe transport